MTEGLREEVGKSHWTNSVTGEECKGERVVRRLVGEKGPRRERKEEYCSEEGRVDGVKGDGQVEVIWMVVGS